jgi:hypothetical protein
LLPGLRRQTLVSGETKISNIALGQKNRPDPAPQVGNCYRNQFELPVLFCVLIGLGLLAPRSRAWLCLWRYGSISH